MSRRLLTTLLGLLLAFVATGAAQQTDTFVLATYNVENWTRTERRGVPDQPKPEHEKAAVVAVLAAIRPDVLGLVEMGTTDDLAELASRLRAVSVEYPYSAWLQAADAERHVALLSRFPLIKQFSRTNDFYELAGRQHPIQRGILDVLVQVNARYSFRALVVHLKSKRVVEGADQAQMRLEEARLVRRHITATLEQQPRLNLALVGDFNDTPESPPVRTILGEGPFALFALVGWDSRGYDTTHFYRPTRTWSRLDYIAVSPGMSNEFVEGSAKIADVGPWREASDHRAIYASFYAQDRNEPEAAAAVPPEAAPFPWVVVCAILLVVVAALLIALVVTVRRSRMHLPPHD